MSQLANQIDFKPLLDQNITLHNNIAQIHAAQTKPSVKPRKYMRPQQRAQMLEIGMAGITKGISTEVRPIFTALRNEIPKASGPVVGLALILLMEGKPDAALEYLIALQDDEFTRKDLVEGITYLAFRGANKMEEAEEYAAKLEFSDSAKGMIERFEAKCGSCPRTSNSI